MCKLSVYYILYTLQDISDNRGLGPERHETQWGIVGFSKNEVIVNEVVWTF